MMAGNVAAAKNLIEMDEGAIINSRRYQKLVCQRRAMGVATAATLVCIVLFVVAIATTMWAIVAIVVPGKDETTTVYLGIWGEWRTDTNHTHSRSTVKIRVKPPRILPPQNRYLSRMLRTSQRCVLHR